MKSKVVGCVALVSVNSMFFAQYIVDSDVVGSKCCSSRYDPDYRSARPERDYPPVRDYPSYRARDYPAGDRDYGPPPPRERDYPAYYTPPRDYPPSDRDYLPPRGRDYPPAGRDYQLPRADDFDLAPRRYSSRCPDFFLIAEKCY